MDSSNRLVLGGVVTVAGEGGDAPVVAGFSDLVQVGRGGFSRVFSAYQVEFDRRVALKVLNDRLADDASVAVFEGECRAMGTLSQHPFIVTVLASALTADYRPVIVMELFERGNYMELLRRDGPLPLEELLSVSVRVAGALATAHHQGVVHGDVKPQNILKSEFGYPALGDFGIATLRNRLSERAGVGLSAHYAAPELIETGAAAGAAADQYSLAATIFTLATGRRPFEGTTPGEAPERILARALSAPTPRLPGSFPDDLADTLARALSRDPHERFGDLASFAYTLTAVEHNLGYRATAVPLPGVDDDATIGIDEPTRAQLRYHSPTPRPAEPAVALPSPSPDEPTLAIPRTPAAQPPSDQPRRRRFALLLIPLLLAAAGAAAYLSLRPGDGPTTPAATAPPDTSSPASQPQPADAEPAVTEPAGAGQPSPAPIPQEPSGAADSTTPTAETSPGQSTTEPAPAPLPALDPFEADNRIALTVAGTSYVLPGPAGMVLGSLSPGAVFPWTYDFDMGTFEAGDVPAVPFDPSIRSASQDYEIAWVSGSSGLERSRSIEESIRSTATASEVHVGTVCDSEFDPGKALACAQTVAASDPDAVIFGNWRSEAAESSMRVFDEARIPVITIDVWHPNAIYVGSNNYVSGALAGIETALHALETWNCEGVHVLLAQTPVEGQRVDLSTSGFADGVRAVCGSDVPLSSFDVDVEWEEGIRSTTDWLAGNPAAERVLATSLTDLLAVSMSVAMEQAGRSGMAAGLSASGVSVARIREGPPEQTRYLGSAAHPPDLYGLHAVAALIDALDGRPVPQEIHILPVWVDHDNVDAYFNTEFSPPADAI